MISFQKWLKNYEKEYKISLKIHFNQNNIGLIPEKFDENLIQLYNAYKYETQTRNLVIVTWVLAGATIILSIATILSNL